MNAKATGLKEIAYEVGYSINTVSRALRDCDDIAESTKEIIRRKAYELGYMPNTVSQFLKRDERKLVGIIVDGFNNFFFTILSSKLINSLKLNDYDYTILSSSLNNEESHKDLIKQCISQRIDAIIPLIELHPSALEMGRQNGLAIICLGNNSDSDNDYVGPAVRGGCNIAASYLLNYHNINKLAYVGHKNVTCYLKRGEIFLEEIMNINHNASFVWLEPEEINVRGLSLIRDGYLGFFCFNDEEVYSCLKKLNDMVPNIRRVYPKFHIIGFDSCCSHITGLLDITSIDYDYDVLAERAVELLDRRLQNPTASKKEYLIETTLHQRKII